MCRSCDDGAVSAQPTGEPGTHPTPGTTGRRRGRRPAGQDTRGALIDAARAVFGESGYEGATVRMIAMRAGVDAAMVNHWFGGKEGLFAQAVLQIPVDPAQLVEQLSGGDPERLGERVVRTFLTVWDSTEGGGFPALVRSIAGHRQVANAMRDLFVKHLFRKVVERIEADHGELRATLVSSQMVGLGMVRYVARFEPLASADADTLVAAIGPNVQRYLTGDLGRLDAVRPV
jgi:AcrR family transcriptional regulator